MWVGQPLHCGTIAKNPICDPGGGGGGGGGKKEGRNTVKTLMLTDNVANQ